MAPQIVERCAIYLIAIIMSLSIAAAEEMPKPLSAPDRRDNAYGFRNCVPVE